VNVKQFTLTDKKKKNFENGVLPLMCTQYFGSINTITMKHKYGKSWEFYTDEIIRRVYS
jgi:hypothetical protein